MWKWRRRSIFEYLSFDDSHARSSWPLHTIAKLLNNPGMCQSVRPPSPKGDCMIRFYGVVYAKLKIMGAVKRDLVQYCCILSLEAFHIISPCPTAQADRTSCTSGSKSDRENIDLRLAFFTKRARTTNSNLSSSTLFESGKHPFKFSLLEPFDDGEFALLNVAAISPSTRLVFCTCMWLCEGVGTSKHR